MREKRLFILSLLSVVMLCVSVCPILAKAPDTPKIVFASSRDGNRDIYLMNPDGTEWVNLTNHPAGDVGPAWSPTGEHIIFSSDRDRSPRSWDLYLMDADGSNVRSVFDKSKRRSGGRWSPDGKQITYTSFEKGQWTVYIASIEDKKEERVALGGSGDWSPDGTKLVMTVGWPERMRIVMLDPQTGKQKFIFPPKAGPSWMGGGVEWSPIRNKLAFSWLHQVPLREFVETETIYIVNPDGTDLRQIVPEGGPRAVSPTWSPRGDTLLYQKLAPGNKWIIFKIGLDGGQPVQLTEPGFHHLGDWFDPEFALPVSPQPQLLTATWGKLKK